MIKSQKKNVLLLEIAIVTVFLMILGAMSLRIFSETRMRSDEGQTLTAASLALQDCAEALYAAQAAPTDFLIGAGWTETDEGLALDDEVRGLRLGARISAEATPSGTIYACALTADRLSDGERIFEMDTKMYRPAEGEGEL